MLVCDKCGVGIVAGARFCAQCGGEVNNSEPAQASVTRPLGEMSWFAAAACVLAWYVLMNRLGLSISNLSTGWFAMWFLFVPLVGIPFAVLGSLGNAGPHGEWAWVVAAAGTIILAVTIVQPIRATGGAAPANKAAQDSAQREFLWIEESKDGIRAILKDGDSAKFRNVVFHQAPGGPPVACGEVNSKNSYGAYTGFERFLAAGKSIAVVESQVQDFGVVWAKFCR